MLVGTGCAVSLFGAPEPPAIPPPPSSAAEAPVVAGPRDVPADVPPPAAARDARIQRWAVQVASIQDREAAHQAEIGLAERGFPAYVLTHPSAEGTWYRVRVGPFGDRGSADAIAATLEHFGHSVWIVAED